MNTESARPGLRQIQREAGRAHIADVAAELFIEGGYANTSVKAIAAAAEVAEATVFNLFDTKATLLREALTRRVMDVVGDWSKRLAEMERRDDPADVIDLFNRFDEQVGPRALGVVRVFLEAAAVDADVAKAWRTSDVRHSWRSGHAGASVRFVARSSRLGAGRLTGGPTREQPTLSNRESRVVS